MVNFAVNDKIFGPNTITQVAADIETELETIDNAKTIRLLEIKHLYGDRFVGVLIIDA